MENNNVKVKRTTEKSFFRNRVKDIIQEKFGIKNLSHNDLDEDVKIKLAMTPHRFNKILANEIDMTVTDGYNLRKWLGVENIDSLLYTVE